MIKEIAFFCSLAAADYGSSRYVINRGGYEANPLIGPGANRQLLIHSGKCLGQGLLASKIKNPKKKKIVLIISGTIAMGFIGNNVIQMRKVR